MRLRSLVPLLLVASPIAINAFGCYGSTEVTLAISTDLVCDGSLDTVFYKGAPQSLDTTPSAETKSCTPATQAGADNQVGTLTLTPSAAKNAQVEVQAVLARNGKDPAKCAGDATDCIIATRTFSFSEHSSQRVAIRLLQECIGTVCPSGQTCISAGVCSSNRVSCSDTGGCTDAGADGGGTEDGGVSTTCEGRGVAHDGVLATADDIPGSQLSALVRGTGGKVSTLRWLAGSTGYSVGVDGLVPAVTVQISPNLDAIEDGRDGRVISMIARSGSTTVTRGTTAQLVANVGDTASIAATSTLTVLAAKSGAYTLSTTTAGNTVVGTLLAPPANAQRAAVVGSTIVVGATDGLHFYVTPNAPTTTPPSVGLPLAPFGSSDPILLAVTEDGTRAAAAGFTADGKSTPVIVDVPSETSPFYPAAFPSQPAIRSLAVDDTHAYWTHETDGISYVTRGKTTAGELVAAGSGKVDHLAVDDTCVYFWEKLATGRANLRAVSRPKD